MPKTMLALIAAAGLGLAAISGAAAVPAAGPALDAVSAASDALHVRDECGRNSHRDASGRCARGCGPGWHFSPRARHCVRGPRQPPSGPAQ